LKKLIKIYVSILQLTKTKKAINKPKKGVIKI